MQKKPDTRKKYYKLDDRGDNYSNAIMIRECPFHINGTLFTLVTTKSLSQIGTAMLGGGPRNSRQVICGDMHNTQGFNIA